MYDLGDTIMASRKLFYFLFILLAIVTGILAWRAGFFSVLPEVIPPNANSLFIMDADYKFAEQIRDQLELSGFVVRDTQYVAIVNSQLVENNDLISLDLGSRTVILQVRSISSDKIIVGVYNQ